MQLPDFTQISFADAMANMASWQNEVATKPRPTYGKTNVRMVPMAGGTKGQAIVAALAEHPDAKVTEIAELCGCTAGRVYEVKRHLSRTVAA